MQIQPRKNRTRKTKFPCLKCYLHLDRCICSIIPNLKLKTKISLIVHHKELHRSTNTGRLAIACLENSQMIIRGESKNHPVLKLDSLLDPNYHSWVFYPSLDAVELTPELVKNHSDLPIQLIVPDGNWRQASKVHYRHHELKDLLRVKISTPNTAPLHMRKETTKEGMATLEAIAHALGIIENEEVKNHLMYVYWRKLEETFKGRGFHNLLLNITSPV